MELYNGRPEDTSGRKEKEIKVYDILDSLHIPYIRADHEAVMTMEACEEIDKALGMEICKNLFLCNRKKTSYYLLLMPGNKALKTKELSQQIPTTRLSFASGEEYLNRLTEFIALLRPDITVERLFSRIPEKDSAFSNWGNSWWKLTDEWKALMEEKGYVQGTKYNYLNGAALNRWEI